MENRGRHVLAGCLSSQRLEQLRRLDHRNKRCILMKRISMGRQVRLALLMCSLASLLLREAAAGPLLTTSGGSIYDVNGKQVVFRGIGWWGFNTAFTALEGLRDGTDSVSQDFATVVWRMRVLGFNAVRLPMRFTEFDLNPLIIKHPCQVAPELNVKYTMVPDAFPNLARTNLSIPAEVVPDVPGGWCSSFFLDTTPTRARYINTVQYLVDLGFYVNIDFHSIDPDVSIHNFEGFISNWTSLVTDILAAAPEAKGRIILDLINEPDGYKFTWDGAGGSMSLSAYYLALMDALYPICPDCLFLVEGTGAGNLAANWGDGFVTQPSIVAKGVSDASTFFNQVLGRPYIAQVVVAPHIYCGDVSGNTYATTGPDLWNRLTETFGYLTSSGYGGHVFTALVDEFGSLFDSNIEQQCFHDIVTYMNNAGGATAYNHQAIQSWFYWSWQPDSYGTGGVTADDYRTIEWFKIDALTGGTGYLWTGLGLCPWYLACYSPVQTLVNPPPPSPDPKLTPIAEPPATPAVACTNDSVSYLGNCTGAVEPAQLYYDSTATTDASTSKRDDIIMYTTIPVGTVVLLAAFAALAALTGCFGAKSAAAKRAAASTPVKAGAYGQSGPIPISVTATAGR